MGGKRMRHEDMRAVSATEAYHAYDRCVGKCMDLTMDVSEKNGGPRQLAKRRVIVESVWPSFVVCTTVPDRRGRTRRMSVSIPDLVTGRASHCAHASKA